MTGFLITLVGTLAAAPSADNAAPRPLVSLSGTMVIKVSDKVEAADALVAETEKLGGYFAARDNDSVVLKVPKEQYQALLELAASLGKVLNRNRRADDLAFELEKQKTLLESREQVLKRYFEVLENAGADAVVTVERQMTALIQQIEQQRGAIRMLEHRLAYAALNVSFQFRERRPPARDGNSSFPWLNTVNLVDLVEDFSREDD